MNKRPELSLVAASQRGDCIAFGELVHRHRRRVFAICLAMLGNQEDAEDAAQEVFVKSLAQLHTLRDGGQFAHWIAQIARNHCRDVHRHRARRRDVSLAETAVGHAVGQAVGPTAPKDFTELRRAIDRLSDDHRLPLLLFYYDGRSVRKLAEELQLSEGGACARLYRARKALRTLLEEQEAGHA